MPSKMRYKIFGRWMESLITPLPFTWISICAIRLEGDGVGRNQIHGPDHASHRDHLILGTHLHALGSFDHQVAVGQHVGYASAQIGGEDRAPAGLAGSLQLGLCVGAEEIGQGSGGFGDAGELRDVALGGGLPLGLYIAISDGRKCFIYDNSY